MADARDKANEIGEPVCIEIGTHWGIEGKVKVRDYGKLSSGYSGSMSRRFVIPDDWTQEQIDDFQREQRQNLENLLEPIDQHHFEERYKDANWSL
jgi:hypothetical protein